MGLLKYIMLKPYKVKVTQSCLTFCNSMNYTVHEILQARILEWVAFPFPRGSSQPRGLSHCRKIFYQLSHKGSPYKAVQYNHSKTWYILIVMVTEKTFRIHCEHRNRLQNNMHTFVLLNKKLYGK